MDIFALLNNLFLEEKLSIGSLNNVIIIFSVVFVFWSVTKRFEALYFAPFQCHFCLLQYNPDPTFLIVSGQK